MKLLTAVAIFFATATLAAPEEHLKRAAAGLQARDDDDDDVYYTKCTCSIGHDVEKSIGLYTCKALAKKYGNVYNDGDGFCYSNDGSGLEIHIYADDCYYYAVEMDSKYEGMDIEAACDGQID